MSSPGSWFQWPCDQPTDLRDWGLQLQQSRTFSDCGAELLGRAPWPWPMYLSMLAWTGRAWLGGYRINRFTLQAA